MFGYISWEIPLSKYGLRFPFGDGSMNGWLIGLMVGWMNG